MPETLTFDEAAGRLEIPRHVLHLWTKKFPLLSPKRSDDGKYGLGTRDLALAQGLKVLLLSQGKNIRDVQQILNDKGASYVIALGKEGGSSGFDIGGGTSAVSEEADRKLRKIFKQGGIRPDQNEISALTMPTKTSTMTRRPFADRVSTGIGKMKSVVAAAADPIVQATKNPPPPENKSEFEDKWRGFMEKSGKIDPVEVARAKADEFVPEEDPADIWFIEDNPDSLLGNMAVKVIPEAPAAPAKPKVKEIIKEVEVVKEVVLEKKTLSEEQCHKVRHVLSKIETLRAELTTAGDVMQKTLKAFGYSGFGDAYAKYDNKSVY